MSPAVLDAMSSLGWTLLDFLWQGALVGFATALALIALRRARPQLRYLAACCGLAMCVAWPAIGLWLRIAHAGAAAAASASPEKLVAIVSVKGGMALLAYLQANMTWLVAAWASCALALALRMLLGLAWVGQSARAHHTDAHWQARLDRLAERAGIGRHVRLRIVDTLASPVTAGWWRPVVLVPAALVSGMPPDLLEALLAHEIAHVKRHDYLVNLLQNVVETLLFYHPAVWWISARIRIEREQMADDFAAAQLGEPRRLARALSELEKLQFSSHHLAQAANGGDLMARIRRLVRPDTQAPGWTSAIPALALAAMCSLAFAHSAPVASLPSGAAYTHAVLDFSSCAKPHYPAEDLEAGHTGAVTLNFLVSGDGEVIRSRVLRSSGHRSLDRAANDALLRCRFKPATRDGQAIAHWQPVQYIWTLN
jgi:D-alanyl-D-alanine endopeptidase (penicillin-binding protein 7)